MRRPSPTPRRRARSAACRWRPAIVDELRSSSSRTRPIVPSRESRGGGARADVPRPASPRRGSARTRGRRRARAPPGASQTTLTLSPELPREVLARRGRRRAATRPGVGEVGGELAGERAGRARDGGEGDDPGEHHAAAAAVGEVGEAREARRAAWGSPSVRARSDGRSGRGPRRNAAGRNRVPSEGTRDPPAGGRGSPARADGRRYPRRDGAALAGHASRARAVDAASRSSPSRSRSAPARRPEDEGRELRRASACRSPRWLAAARLAPRPRRSPSSLLTAARAGLFALDYPAGPPVGPTVALYYVGPAAASRSRARSTLAVAFGAGLLRRARRRGATPDGLRPVRRSCSGSWSGAAPGSPATATAAAARADRRAGGARRRAPSARPSASAGWRRPRSARASRATCTTRRGTRST